MVAGEPTASRERSQGKERVIARVGEESGKEKVSGAVVESTASEEATAEVGEEKGSRRRERKRNGCTNINP